MTRCWLRVGRDFALSARGLALVEPVREMLLRAERMLGTQPVFDASSVRRTFSIMIPDFVVPSLLPRILRRLGEWAPGRSPADGELVGDGACTGAPRGCRSASHAR